MSRLKKVKAIEPCEFCDSDAKTNGLCSACYQGLRRLMKQDLAYVNTYLYRVGRFTTRGKYAHSEHIRATRKKAKAA